MSLLLQYTLVPILLLGMLQKFLRSFLMKIIFSAGQHISIHGLDGAHVNTIQNYEGFMGARIGQTSCLSFHPHKVSLAAGFFDNHVSVFTIGDK